MSEVRLAAESRQSFGKGAARRLRRDGRVPAVIYGHGTDPRHISLPGHDLMLALKTPNVLLTLDLADGQGQELVLPKQVQRDPIRGNLEHVDLVLVRRGEKVVVDIPLHLIGEVRSGSILGVEQNTLSLEAEATHIPSQIEYTVEGLIAPLQVLAGQIPLPEGVTLAIDPDVLVLNITEAPTAEQVDADLASAEAGAGIVHDAPSAESDNA